MDSRINILKYQSTNIITLISIYTDIILLKLYIIFIFYCFLKILKETLKTYKIILSIF